MRIGGNRAGSWTLAAVVAAFTNLPARAEQITWDGDCGTKSWNTQCIDRDSGRLKTNWVGDDLPTASSDVVIPAGAGEVQVDGFTRINSIEAASKLTVAANLQLVSTQQASTIKDLSVDEEAQILVRKELTLSGTSTVKTGGFTQDPGDSATVINAADGTFAIGGPSPGPFATNFLFITTFRNKGTVNQTGPFSLADTTIENEKVWSIVAGENFENEFGPVGFGNGTFNNLSGGTFGMTGTKEVLMGSTLVNQDGGTVIINGGTLTLLSALNRIEGGTMQIGPQGLVTIEPGSPLNPEFFPEGEMDWSGGSIIGTADGAPGVLKGVGGAATIDDFRELFRNGGTVTIGGTNGVQTRKGLFTNNGKVIQTTQLTLDAAGIRNKGTWELRSGRIVPAPGTISKFFNEGKLIKRSAGAEAVAVDVDFDGVGGDIEVSGSTVLSLGGQVKLGGGRITLGGGTLYLGGLDVNRTIHIVRNQRVAPPASVVVLSNIVVDASSVLDLSDVESIFGGSVSGPPGAGKPIRVEANGTLKLIAGNFQATVVRTSGSNRKPGITITGGSVFPWQALKLDLGTKLENRGRVVPLADVSQAPGTKLKGIIVNRGTIEMGNTTGVIGVKLDNRGVVKAWLGGSLTLTGTVVQLKNQTLTAGRWIAESGKLRLGDTPSNTPTISRSSGTIELTNGGSFFNLRSGETLTNRTFINAGTMRLSHTTFEIYRFINRGRLQLDEGGIVKADTIVLDRGSKVVAKGGKLQGKLENRGGRVQIGKSPGLLLVEGDYTHPVGGSLEIELAGTEPGTEHDQLQVTGNASVGGSLLVRHLDGYAPLAGTSFEVISAGTFTDDGFSLALLDGGLVEATIDEGAQSLRFTAVDGKTYTAAGAWDDTANWSGGGPGADDSVLIPGAPGGDVTVSGPAEDAAVQALAIGSGNPGSTTVTSLALDAGTLTAARGTTVRTDGMLEGAGTLAGAVYNAGRVRAGTPTGPLTIDGRYIQRENATLEIELGGPGQHGSLQLTGLLVLDGVLEVRAAEGFTPDPGDAYPILAYGSRLGDFARIENSTGVGDLIFDIVYDDDAGTGTLTVSAIEEDVDRAVVLDTSSGAIVLDLDPERAPVTAANFYGHVDAGFYDGLIFHDVVAGSHVQAGAFNAELDFKEPGPPIVNESDNGLLNLRGSIAMHRGEDPDSAAAEFLINIEDTPERDHGFDPENPVGHTVFGRVAAGMDVVDGIGGGETEEGTTPAGDPLPNLPVEPVVIEKASSIIAWTFAIEGSQQVPPVDSAASGVGRVFFDPRSSRLWWRIGIEGLEEDYESITGAQFRGPAPPGQTGEVVIDLLDESDLDDEFVSRRAVTLESEQQADLLAGLWYVHVETAAHPSGELRGQVTPSAPTLPPVVEFRRGDSNTDGVVDLADVVATLAALFLEEGEMRCRDAADSNDDGALDVTDAVRTLVHLFEEDVEIPSPGLESCGPDPTGDNLDCAEYGAACGGE